MKIINFQILQIMGKKKKSKGNKMNEKKMEVDINPDPTSTEFMYDEVDQFHMEQEKILLSKGAKIHDRSQGFQYNKINIIKLSLYNTFKNIIKVALTPKSL